MLLTLVKNNFKLIMRNKLSIVFMIILPILLIYILSSALVDTLNDGYELKELKVGYNLEEGTNIEKNFQGFIDGFKENKITLINMNKDEAMKDLEDEKIISYVEVGDESYKVYDKNSSEGAIFISTFKITMDSYSENKILMEYILENRINPKNISQNNTDLVKIETIESEPVPSALDYYGITEIVYIAWFGMLIVSMLINDERKYKVTNRLFLTNASPSTLFFGRLIAGVLAISIQIAIGTFAANIFMGINWGTQPIVTILILLLEIIASISIGIMLTQLIKSSAVVNIIIVISTVFFGFVGGAFQPYMYNFVGDFLPKLSPVYHINRTLVELSSKGESNCVVPTIGVLLMIILISMIIGMISIRKERRAL